MAERQRAHHDVDVVVGERQPVQVGGVELGSRYAGAGGAVHADDPVAARGEVFGVPAGAAGRVQRDAGRQRVDDLGHERFFVAVQPVARQAVALDRVDPLGRDPLIVQGAITPLTLSKASDD